MAFHCDMCGSDRPSLKSLRRHLLGAHSRQYDNRRHASMPFKGTSEQLLAAREKLYWDRRNPHDRRQHRQEMSTDCHVRRVYTRRSSVVGPRKDSPGPDVSSFVQYIPPSPPSDTAGSREVLASVEDGASDAVSVLTDLSDGVGIDILGPTDVLGGGLHGASSSPALLSSSPNKFSLAKESSSMGGMDVRPPVNVQPAEIAAAVGRNVHQSAAEIAAALARQWCVPPAEMSALNWAVDTAVLTHRLGAATLIQAVNDAMMIEPTGGRVVPIVSNMLHAAVARPH